MGKLKASPYVKVEQLVRGIAFAHYFVFFALILFLDIYLKGVYSWVNKVSGNYFSNNYKRGTVAHYYIWQWVRGFIAMFGLKTVVEYKFDIPKTSKENTVIMFTHGCNLDPFLIQGTYPYFCHFIAKKSLFNIPIFGRSMANCGQIPIDRENLTNAIATLQEAANIAIQGNKTVAISAEGKRRRSPSVGREQLLPFKKGPFHLTKAIGVDVVPCVIHGGNRIWKAGSIVPLPGTFIIRYLERIPAEKVKTMTVEELQAEVKKRLEAELDVVPDEVIGNTDDKPYALFLITLVVMIGYYALWFRFLFGGK